MQTDFQVQWVPLPAERQSEWRHAIELIAEIMKGYVMQIQTQHTVNRYRFAWIDPRKEGRQYGTFLFNTPEEAKAPKEAMKTMFSDFIIWLEDDQHNRVEIQ